MNIGFRDIQKHHDLFTEHVRCGNVDGLRAWKNCGPTSPLHLYRQGLSTAVAQNDVPCVGYLLEHLHFYNENILNEHLLQAVSNNHVALVETLVKVANPQFDYNLVLRVATLNNFQEVFDILYPLSDPLEAKRIMQENKEAVGKWTLLDQRLDSDHLQDMLKNVVCDELKPQRPMKL